MLINTLPFIHFSIYGKMTCKGINKIREKHTLGRFFSLTGSNLSLCLINKKLYATQIFCQIFAHLAENE